ncbi:MAG TPA: hypothetical protein VE965_00540 [Gammaproteobacteria bacterium]|nr:hypothetical protein [Gammaproteobacteria bacterium]
MKWADIEWPIVRGALGLLGGCLLVSALLFASSFHFRDQMALLLQKHELRFKDISRNYLTLKEKNQILKEDYPRFVGFYNQGIIGPEQRLNWVETLRHAAATIKIPALRYEVGSRQAYTPEFNLSTAPYQIYTSTMKLNLGMLHENDLVRLLEELDKNAYGLYSVKECALKRVARRLEQGPQGQNVSAECTLLWFTLNLSSGNEIVLQH